MIDFVMLGLALMVGFFLGALFFGGLWWTVRRTAASRSLAILMTLSLLLRTGIVLTGFYFMGRDHWDRLLICALGFFVARLVVIRMTRLKDEGVACLPREGRHAS